MDCEDMVIAEEPNLVHGSKWAKDETGHLLDMLECYPFLFTSACRAAPEKAKRNSALNRIVEEMQKYRPRTTLEHVTTKIKTLKDQYRVENLRRMGSTKSGTRNIYVPRLWCFGRLHLICEGEKGEQIEPIFPISEQEQTSLVWQQQPPPTLTPIKSSPSSTSLISSTPETKSLPSRSPSPILYCPKSPPASPNPLRHPPRTTSSAESASRTPQPSSSARSCSPKDSTPSVSEMLLELYSRKRQNMSQTDKLHNEFVKYIGIVLKQIDDMDFARQTHFKILEFVNNEVQKFCETKINKDIGKATNYRCAATSTTVATVENASASACQISFSRPNRNTNIFVNLENLTEEEED